MALLYSILIAAALAAGIFATVSESGANIVKLDKRLTGMGLLTGALQLGGTALGYLIGKWILTGEVAHERSLFWSHVLAGVLLAVVGIRMLLAAFSKKTRLEHRIEKINMQEDTLNVLRLCVNSLLAGVACGLMEFNLFVLILTVFIATTLSTVGGYISGRAYGADSTKQAWAGGGALLCVIGVILQLL